MINNTSENPTVATVTIFLGSLPIEIFFRKNCPSKYSVKFSDISDRIMLVDNLTDLIGESALQGNQKMYNLLKAALAECIERRADNTLKTHDTKSIFLEEFEPCLPQIVISLTNAKLVKKKRSTKELKIQKRLAQELDGKKEIITESGNIDILTDLEIIEIKNSKNWKDGVGQVLCYHQYFPKHQPRIHLFSCDDKFNKDMVETVCKHLGIRVTYEENGC